VLPQPNFLTSFDQLKTSPSTEANDEALSFLFFGDFSFPKLLALNHQRRAGPVRSGVPSVSLRTSTGSSAGLRTG
jgi:hypothetical protein